MKGKGLKQAHGSLEIVQGVAGRDSGLGRIASLCLQTQVEILTGPPGGPPRPLCLSIFPLAGWLPVCPTYVVLPRYFYLQWFARPLLSKSALVLDALVLELLPGGGEKNGQRRFD